MEMEKVQPTAVQTWILYAKNFSFKEYVRILYPFNITKSNLEIQSLACIIIFKN